MVGDGAYTANDIQTLGLVDTEPDFSNSDRLFAERLGVSFKDPQAFFG